MRLIAAAAVGAGLAANTIAAVQPPARQMVTTQLTKTDDGYRFEGRFSTHAPVACLLDVVYDVRHISRFAGSQYEVTLVHQDEGWNDIRFRSRGFGYDVAAVYRRRLDVEHARVTFELVDADQHGLVPRVEQSAGFYAVEPDEGGRRLRYVESVVLGKGPLRGLYLDRASREGRRFMQRLRAYAIRTCD